MPAVFHPVFAGVDHHRRVCFANLQAVESKAEFGDFGEELVSQVFDAGRGVEQFHSQRFARSFSVTQQRFVKRIRDMNQHRMVIFRLEKRLDLSVEFAEQSADRSRAFDFEEASDAVAMPMQIPTFVIQFFVAMGRVELVVLLNYHRVVRFSEFWK